MRNFFNLLLFFILLIGTGFAQTPLSWPKAIQSDGYTIKIYQPQVESYVGDTVKTRGAFSILAPGKPDPVFGALWMIAMLQTNRDNRTAILQKIKINEIKFAGDSNTENVDRLKAIVEKEIPKWDLVFSLDQLESSIEGDGTNGDAGSYRR
jgi:hypothetical protein